MEEKGGGKEELPHFSCTPAFDALWFCYSPVYQMKEYYREGVFDDCTGKWADLVRCFKLKTKPLAEAHAAMRAREEESPPHIWEFRTPQEAAAEWNRQFS